MIGDILSKPSRILDLMMESTSVSGNLAVELKDWILHINRLRILSYTRRRFPDLFHQLDGTDRWLLNAFLEPDALSNTLSLLGTDVRKFCKEKNDRVPLESHLLLECHILSDWLSDAFGKHALDDTPVIEHSPEAHQGDERWFFINGIMTSRELARANVKALESLLDRKFILIHNPTHGLVGDLLESAIQKFINIGTSTVAQAFVAIGEALCDPKIEKVVVVGHSQGTIISGDVLDLIYSSFEGDNYHLTNMVPEEVDHFRNHSFDGLPRTRVQTVMKNLKYASPTVLEKLELYMFANAASRMRYFYPDPEKPQPHLESFANHHDIVSRLGCLAQDEFHRDDLVHIDGPLFTNKSYGHLLNEHYLHGIEKWLEDGPIPYTLCPSIPGRCVSSSVHNEVQGNPCAKNPDYRPGGQDSEFLGYCQETL